MMPWAVEANRRTTAPRMSSCATREQFREQRLRQGRSAFGRAGKSGVTPVDVSKCTSGIVNLPTNLLFQLLIK
jgi:hypothetical protein